MSELLSACGALATRDGFSLPASVQLAEVEEILTAQAMLAGVLARRLRAVISSDATTGECGRTTRSWLVEEMRLSPTDAHRRVAAAYASAELVDVDAAAVAGDIHPDHVAVIGTCVRKLPAAWQATGETVLVEAARSVDPVALGRIARELRIRSGADESIEAAEARRYASRYVTTTATFEGMIHLDGMLDPEAGRTLLTALNPLMGSGGSEDLRSAAQRRADALVDLARLALTTDLLPDHNGTRPQLIVTIDEDSLRQRVSPGTREENAELDADRVSLPAATLAGSAVPLTTASARRLGCDAGIIPAVLGSRSEPLDIGRTTRVWTISQRRAAHLRDNGCVFPRCTAGPDHTDLHHLRHWADGGETSLANAATLCRYHHWLVHHTGWELTHDPGHQWTAMRR